MQLLTNWSCSDVTTGSGWGFDSSPGCWLLLSKLGQNYRGRWSGGFSSAPYHPTRLPKLQGLVYDSLPSTTAVFSYAIGSRKLSANEQFFVGSHTVVSLLQTTQIIWDVCFITDHVAYASSNRTKIVWIKMELFSSFFFTRGGCASCWRTCLGARLLLQSY